MQTMQHWRRNFPFCVFVIQTITSLVSCQPNNCSEFKVIPPDQYDNQASSLNDITKHPLGFSFGIAHYPGVQTNVQNPCVYLSNLTSRAVEVMVQTRVPGKSVCVKDSSPQPNMACDVGAFVAGCWEATSDLMMYTFYCDPGKGCDTDVQFWFRLTPSTGDDIDKWCLSRGSDDFPDTLRTPPPTVIKPTTVLSHAMSHVSFCYSFVFSILLSTLVLSI